MIASSAPSVAPKNRVGTVHARTRLLRIGSGWVAVALLEAAAYTALAVSIAQHRPPGLVMTITLLSLMLTVLVSRAGYVSGVRLAGDLYSGLGAAMSRAKLSWFSADTRALVAAVASRGIPGMMGVPAHQLQSYLVAPLLPVFLLVGIFVLGGPSLGLLIAGLLAVSLAGQGVAQRWLASADARRHDAEHVAARATLELVEHLELLRTAAGPERAVARLEESWRGQEAAVARTNLAAAPALFIAVLATALPLGGLVVFLTLTGGVPPATTLALVVLTSRAAAPLEALALAGLGVNQLRSTVVDYRTASDAPALSEPSVAAAPEGDAIALHGVTQPPMLSDVTVSVQAGERVVISGRTGSGKSTLLGLLMRFDDPAAGTITVGGVPLPELGTSQLIERIAYVPQRPVVFTGTLAENVALGRMDATDLEIEDAVHRAALDDVITRHPLGIHQSVGQNGAALSGGEQQRVTIARALLKNAPILVLDEATSALDEHTERKIAVAVRELTATVLIVTHRDHTIWDPTSTIDLDAPQSVTD